MTICLDKNITDETVTQFAFHMTDNAFFGALKSSLICTLKFSEHSSKNKY